MKLTPVILIVAIFSSISYSQHNYSNPRTREKRMLLEEPVEENTKEKNNEESTQVPDGNSRFTKGQEHFCSCEKTYFLSVKRLKLRDKLVSKGLIKNVYTQHVEYSRHKDKSRDAMRLMRGRYEVEESFDCEHENLSFKKLSEYTKAISSLVDKCDVEIITE